MRHVAPKATLLQLICTAPGHTVKISVALFSQIQITIHAVLQESFLTDKQRVFSIFCIWDKPVLPNLDLPTLVYPKCTPGYQAEKRDKL